MLVLHCMSPLLAQSRHHHSRQRCLLLGVKRTSQKCTPMSANDPKRTSSSLPPYPFRNTAADWYDPVLSRGAAMRRRDFIRVVVGSAAAFPFAARAQQPDRIRRIGVISNVTAEDEDSNARLKAFQQRLQQLGWTDGHNVRIDYRFAAANLENYRKYAAELVALAPDVILAPGTSLQYM